MSEDDTKHDISSPHRLSLPELVSAFVTSNIHYDQVSKQITDANGLNSEIARRRLEEEGLNQLTPPKQTPQWKIFLLELANPFLLMLSAAAILSIIAFAIEPASQLNLWLGIVLFVVVVAMAVMSYVQRRKSSNLMNLFANMVPSKTICIRDGETVEIETRNLVVGDIVQIKEGEIVPADGRLIQCNNLKIERSALTGESVPIQLHVEREEEETLLLESNCMVFSGCQCVQGIGLAVISATGDDTAIGQIASGTKSKEDTDTQLTQEMRQFVKFVSVLAVCLATVFFIIGVARTEGRDVLSFFVNGFLIVIIANIPQGLPATVTSMLTITAKRMASKNIFVKKLEHVESLGSASVIASDKTGTITENKMTLREVWVDGNLTHSQDFNPSLLQKSIAARWLHCVSNICNAAVRLNRDDNSSQNYSGNAADIALKQFSEPLKTSNPIFNRSYKIVKEIPFNSRNKWQMMLGSFELQESDLNVMSSDTSKMNNSTTHNLIIMKGAPERILQKCTSIIQGNELKPLNDHTQGRVTSSLNYFARQSRRVLGICVRLHDENDVKLDDFTEGNAPESNFIFLGLVALADPPRADVAEAIAKCKAAGIKVFMVTGDHALTAASIAEEVGILSHNEHHALTCEIPGMVRHNVFQSHYVDQFTEEHWKHVVSLDGAVFARATPQEKLIIVENCQNLGEIVAVTGDGVNDAPALKQADLGIAMGLKGNAVACEAASVLLMDDNFASIVKGVLEGRLIIENLRKTLRYLLTHLLPEIFPVLLTLAFGLPLGLTSLQILTIDLLTEMAASITLAYEPPEPNLMTSPPRGKNEKLVTSELLIYAYVIAGMFESLACFLAYFYVLTTFDLSLSDVFLTAEDHFKRDAKPLCLDDGRCLNQDQQDRIAYSLTAAWYVTLIMSQVIHLWIIKASPMSIFRRSPFTNLVAFYGVLVEVLIMIIVLYVPGVQEFFGTTAPIGYSWAFFMIFAVLAVIYNETRVLIDSKKSSLPTSSPFKSGQKSSQEELQVTIV